MGASFEVVPAGGVTSAAGFVAGGVYCGIKTSGDGKRDLGVVASERPTTSALVVTKNKLKGSSLKLTIRRAAAGPIRAAVVNSGNANSSTGAQGDADAEEMAALAAALLGIPEGEVATGSTGVIGRLMPMDRVREGFASIALTSDGGAQFARAIMTTDLRSKEHAVRFEHGGRTYTVGGCAKGSGMIHPNMATMLSFVTTDAPVEAAFLDAVLRRVADRTYNMVTVDGDTSCDDMVLLMANGAAGGEPIRDGEGGDVFEGALFEVCRHLAREIARDGEGASKLIEVTVETAATEDDARKAALAVAGSMLTKAAVKGSDPNWGRIMNAVGYSGADMVEERACVYIDDIQVYREGLPVPFDEKAASARMSQPEVRLRVTLGLGDGAATAWGCDLTEEYVRINADYTT